ncbi:hypothetical protein RFI_18382 [Reticulomyxa filosa]|uniref:Ion transport domain-containing protein n=1 Tax=Reticulomyxa filosa TaxID=46433 RepID=X6MZ07_RETFI|nr:hypothetical protein RFI_18382 [Reticulomyxa filosa]|eukprot:ETO18858.1 hypothetical protein RFI_18382 [Reticulomyxa filosa]
MLVVIVAVFGLIFPEVTFLRGLRAIRPIRVAIRVKQEAWEGINFFFFLFIKVVKEICHITKKIYINIYIRIHIFIYKYVTCKCFLNRCVAIGEPFVLQDPNQYPDKESCKNGVVWVNAGFNFDNVFSSLLTIFKVTNFAHWFEELASSMATVSDFKQAVPFHRPEAAVYFVCVALIGGFFLWNILVSVVVDSFMRIKKEEETTGLVTQDQAIWIQTRRYVERFPLLNSLKEPHAKWRQLITTLLFEEEEEEEEEAKVFALVTNDYFEYFIVGCIVVNVVFMMSSYEKQPQSWAVTLWAIDVVFVTIYWIEAILKIVGLGLQYFQSWWNLFDFAIIIASVVSIGLGSPGQHYAANGIRLIRAIRIVRLLRRAPVLRALFMTLIYAAPSLLNIGLLLFVAFFIWGIFGMELFGTVVHNDGYGNHIPYG